MKRVLICDDEPHVLEGLRFLLRAPDRKIETAVNGAIGLARVREEMPDLLITDVMMPEMSGLELVAALREDERTRRLSVVILTAKGQAQDAAVAQEVWGATVIAKPFDPKTVRELVAKMLGNPACLQTSSR
jgi:CheY-like chemotaxis protein